MSRQLTVPATDTHLHAIDTPGGEPAVLFVNGGFGTMRNWQPVIAKLNGAHRTVQFDARARGRSGTSTDYSVQTAVDDIGRVIDATGIERPILVGWSHGATLAIRYAAAHPDRVRGMVLVDGAYPISMFDEAGKQKVRDQFRKLGWIMKVLGALRLSARMSAAQSADVVIEMDAVNGQLVAGYAALTCPTAFVVGTGGHQGATEEEMRTVRGAVTTATGANDRVAVFATSPHNHTQLLRKSPDLIAAAVEHVSSQATSQPTT
jgi:pimeloyl-ACP methyl ester carboxylesterase